MKTTYHSRVSRISKSNFPSWRPYCLYSTNESEVTIGDTAFGLDFWGFPECTRVCILLPQLSGEHVHSRKKKRTLYIRLIEMYEDPLSPKWCECSTVLSERKMFVLCGSDSVTLLNYKNVCFCNRYKIQDFICPCIHS